MLSHLEFLVVIFLLLWLIRRVRTPWVYNMYLRRILGQLDRIEAHTRGVPIEQIEKEFSAVIHTETAIHDGTPFWERMWR